MACIRQSAELGMTVATDCATATECAIQEETNRQKQKLQEETNRQRQKRGVACHWLPSGKCMISPPPKRRDV